MAPLRVLISGASIAGPALAFWLVRAGCIVTLVERAPTLRSAGQGIDVRDTARDVIKRMKLFDLIRSKSSHEEGIRVVNAKNDYLASFPVDLESGTGSSATCDIEILRGELAGILYDATKDDITYIFGDTVSSFSESGSEVTVTFSKDTPTQTFDLVVAADGLGSKIRGMALGSCEIRSLNSYVSYFSLPVGETDSMWARVHWPKKGRTIAFRPDNYGTTRAFLGLTAYKPSDPRLKLFADVIAKGDVKAQKALIQELFQDSGFEIERTLKGMHAADDFYLQHVAQVRLDKWSNGHITAVGDACYAPSPYTGMGTSIAFIGAYILAGEISKIYSASEIPSALAAYEKILRPYVESIQHLPPGVPWILNPQSALGVRILETAAWVVGKVARTWIPTAIEKIAGWLPGTLSKKFELPQYEAFKAEVLEKWEKN